MKGLIALCLFVTSFAHAAEFLVYETSSANIKVLNATLAATPASNKAWVQITKANSATGRQINRNKRIFSVKIPGLTFNSETGKVMWDVDGQQVECGYRTGWGIFKYIAETGCTLETRSSRNKLSVYLLTR